MRRLFGAGGVVLSTALAVGLAAGLWAHMQGQGGATEWFVSPGGAGPGTSEAPFARIQDALNAAAAGDTITVRPGTYVEAIHSVRGGAPDQPIRLRSIDGRGAVVVTATGRVLTVTHPYLTVEGVIFDGQYGTDDTVRIGSDAHAFTLRNAEVRRSSRDLVDIAAPRDVLVEDSLIHHALDARNGRSDAHGIAAGAVQGLTLRTTEIHTFSGDAVQVDPGRSSPGWTGVLIEGCRFWLAPLAAAENGFAAGSVPGENALDTKASADLPRATITIRDTTASGFRAGIIANMAAFNLKENVDALVDRVTVWDSEIAFRLRGPTASAPTGARVTVMNAVVHNVAAAFRYEDDIELLRVWNSTIGLGVERPFLAASSSSDGLDVQNVLILGARPREANRPSNLNVGRDAFVDAAAHDYMPAPGALPVDAGVTIAEVGHDRLGAPRPRGRGYDIGAYERPVSVSEAQ